MCYLADTGAAAALARFNKPVEVWLNRTSLISQQIKMRPSGILRRGISDWPSWNYRYA